MMVHGGVKYPSVYTVDRHVPSPPLPPRLTRDQQQQQQQRTRPAQTLLFLLVSLALSGMVIEACFIYHLYQTNTEELGLEMEKYVKVGPFSQNFDDVLWGTWPYDKGTGQEIIPSTWHGLIDAPSKPVAHLTDGTDVVHKDKMMRWSSVAQPILYKLDYTDGSLVIQTQGYYYVYSKVSFREIFSFHHSIHVKTKMYLGKSIPLLQSSSYSGKSNKIQSNSYLGGVFHFYKDDAVFVQVSNTTQIVRHKACENVFGVVMM